MLIAHFGQKMKYHTSKCPFSAILMERSFEIKPKSYLASTTKLSAAFSLLSFSLVGSKTISNMFLTLVDVFDRSSSFMETALCNLRTGEKNSKSTNFDIEDRNEITKSKRCWLQWIFTWQGLAGFPYCLGPLCEPLGHLCRLSQLGPAPRKPDISGKGLWGHW